MAQTAATAALEAAHAEQIERLTADHEAATTALEDRIAKATAEYEGKEQSHAAATTELAEQIKDLQRTSSHNCLEERIARPQRPTQSKSKDLQRTKAATTALEEKQRTTQRKSKDLQRTTKQPQRPSKKKQQTRSTNRSERKEVHSVQRTAEQIKRLTANSKSKSQRPQRKR